MTTTRPSPEWTTRADARDQLLSLLEALHRAAAAGFALPRLANDLQVPEDPFRYSTNEGTDLHLPGPFVKKALDDLCRNGSDCQLNFDALITRATLASAHELFKEYLGIGYANHSREGDKAEFDKSGLGKLGWDMRDAVSHSAAGDKVMENGHDFGFIKIAKGQTGLNVQAGSVLAYLGALDELARERFTGALKA